MSRRTIAIAAALSVLALGSPLITGCTNPLETQTLEFMRNFSQGLEKYEAGNYQGAITDYDKAIEIDSQSAFAYYNRGIAKYNLEDYQGAISDYTKAIEINPHYSNPQYADAYHNRGNAKKDFGDYQGAIVDYDKAIEINPQYGNAYNNRGAIKDASGDRSSRSD